MQNRIRQEIFASLAKESSKVKENFSSEGIFDLSDLHIEVEGLGVEDIRASDAKRQLTLPLTPEDIQTLISLSSKAKFGLKEKTLLDETVRDTQEISSDRMQVTIEEASLTSMLTKMRHDLGLSNHVKLIPHLHNMLIYGPGQFFKEHQDSEKIEGMVATLVIVLPFPHIGGNLVIKHNKQKEIFSSENIGDPRVKYISFYADCLHRVEPVKEGYRVCLTYNLVLESEKITVDDYTNASLEKALEEYFRLESGDSPLKLVYFLDHSYTEHSLRWDMLKGADRKNALSFYSAAKKLHLIPYLALAEVHESWTTEGDDKDPEIDELIENNTTLSHWVDSNNRTLPFAECNAHLSEIVLSNPMRDPVDSDYEGWMGNYGNTMDYWYRRAAIVLWHASNEIAMNFYLNHPQALKDLAELTKVGGQEKKVFEIIEKAGKYFKKPQCDPQHCNFSMFSSVSLYIKDKETAAHILSPFEWTVFNSEIAKDLINLAILYGIDWCIALMNHWKKKKEYGHIVILNSVTPIIGSLLALEDSLEANMEFKNKLSTFILETQVEAIIDHDKSHQRSSPIELEKVFIKRINHVIDFMKACALTKSASLVGHLLSHMIENPRLYSEIRLSEIFFEMRHQIPSQELAPYKLLHDHLVKVIDQELEKGLRSSNDWSIPVALTCACEYCKDLEAFLHASTETRKVWPVAAKVRDHLQRVISGFMLPVNLSIEKTGSPHKLIITKTDKVYQEAKRRFKMLTHHYQNLVKD